MRLDITKQSLRMQRKHKGALSNMANAGNISAHAEKTDIADAYDKLMGKHLCASRENFLLYSSQYPFLETSLRMQRKHNGDINEFI